MTDVWRERTPQIIEIAGVAPVKVLADDCDVRGFDVFHHYLTTYET
jgi:hypothetical protein